MACTFGFDTPGAITGKTAGQDGRVEATIAPLHGAAARSRAAEQAPNVRAQGRASSARLPFGEHQGQFCRHDAGKTVMPGAMVFRPFLP
jgi:hypothetical protein